MIFDLHCDIINDTREKFNMKNEEKIENGFVKDVKPKRIFNKLWKTIAMGALTLGIALSGAFAFTGCSSNSQPTPEPPPIDIVDPTPEPTPETSITMEEFMTDHKGEATNFINVFIKPSVVGEKEVLSENWGLTANSEDELSALQLFYTYKQDETSRTIEVANVTLDTPIDLDNIVENKVTEGDVSFSTERESVFTFDAKEIYKNLDLANALYNITGDSSSVMVYSEIETTRPGVRTFKIAEETQDHQLKIFNVVTDCGNSTAELIENLKYSYNYDIQLQNSYTLGENRISVQNYTQEEFAPETVDDVITDYNEAITTALNENFLESIGKACYTRYFDPTLLENVIWDIGNGEEISEVKFISYYNKSDTDKVYSIGTITLNSPINIKDLNKSNINDIFAEKATSATYNLAYSFGFDKTKQNDRNDLVNAIFEAYGMTKEVPEGAIRYYIDKGDTLDSDLQSEAREFKVVEIANNYVKEFSIIIKDSANDNGYIEKLQNSTNYLIYGEKSYEMNGQKITGEDKSQESDSELTTYSNYALEYDDYDL